VASQTIPGGQTNLPIMYSDYVLRSKNKQKYILSIFMSLCLIFICVNFGAIQIITKKTAFLRSEYEPLLGACFMLHSSLACSSTLKMDSICSLETSIYFHRNTRRSIPEENKYFYRNSFNNSVDETLRRMGTQDISIMHSFYIM
jgi:hypothetical protein